MLVSNWLEISDFSAVDNFDGGQPHSWVVFLIGMGDAKLFLIAAPWLHYDNLSKALVMMIAVSWAQLLVGSALKGKVLQRIAFAPAILSAVILNLAT